jgi:hypothetical protein
VPCSPILMPHPPRKPVLARQPAPVAVGQDNGPTYRAVILTSTPLSSIELIS